jgi:hypothetical protein
VRRIGWLTLAAALLSVGLVHAATIRMAVVVGNNQGQGRRTLHYAEADARKVRRTLIQLGGFAPQNTRLLLGRDARAVWRAIRAIERQMRRLRGPGDRILFLFYYSGHADGDALELGDSVLRYGRLRHYLERGGADVRVALIDSCRSGTLVAMKGGQPSPGYRVAVTDEIFSSGYAVITSSAANELSQESHEVRGSYFTHYLVSALHGAADTRRDGRITLDEAYRYVFAQTVARTSATVGGGQHPMFAYNLRGWGGVVLSRTGGQSNLAVRSSRRGRVVVLDRGASAVVAEAAVAPKSPARLTLPPGRYVAYLIHGSRVRRASVTLHRGRGATLSPRAFAPHKPERAVSKGGLFSAGPVHRLSAGALVQRVPLEGGGVALGGSVVYRLELASGLQPVARVTFARGVQSAAQGFFAVGGAAGLGYVLRWRRLALRCEAVAGYEHLQQAEQVGDVPYSSAFAYLGSLGVETYIGSFLIGLDVGAGGDVFRVDADESVDPEIVHRLSLQGMLNIGWSWGS